MSDGITKLREAAQSLADLSSKYPNGRTKAILLRASAEIFQHVEECHFAINSSNAQALEDWLKDSL